ncbi:hypothetical protein CDL15_Pgr025759 [Punica granatum]|uniref:Cation/H+ exchanger transmembrane domain-containing protein n=1 Tax=Punica granatum TaxID=22663 RepID=A0A218WC37_PUNGR|nr:hypothetical protein CDL15_Pgr025759 [Punica granatum]
MLALPLSGITRGFSQGLMTVFLSLTRFPNVTYELNILASDLGQLAMSSSIPSEFFSWLWVVIRISYRQTMSIHFTGAILSTVFFILFILFAVRPLIQMLANKAPEGKPVKEVFVVMILVGALIGALLSDFIGALQIGVLFMGLIIPTGTPLGTTLIEKAEFIVMEVIFPMFYVVIGAKVDLTMTDFKTRKQILLAVFAGFIAKFAAGIVMLLEAMNPTKTAPLSAHIVHLRDLVGNMHEYIYRLAQDELIPLIILPFHQMMTEIDHAEATSLRNLNITVQAHAPCTVRILVDKTVHNSMSRTTFKYNWVIFISVADDREALSLAIHMSGHLTVSTTVFRLIIESQDMNSISLLERKLDLQVIEEFNVKTIKNERATYLELVVQDTEQGFTKIQSLRCKHDLLIAGGQRRGEISV